MAGFLAMLTAVALTGVASAQQGVSFPTQDGRLIYADTYGEVMVLCNSPFCFHVLTSE